MLSLFVEESILGCENRGTLMHFLGSGRIGPADSLLILIASCVEAPLLGGGAIGLKQLVGVDDLGWREYGRCC